MIPSCSEREGVTRGWPRSRAVGDKEVRLAKLSTQSPVKTQMEGGWAEPEASGLRSRLGTAGPAGLQSTNPMRSWDQRK